MKIKFIIGITSALLLISTSSFFYHPHPIISFTAKSITQGKVTNVIYPGNCSMNGLFPDKKCTPGEVNDAVNQNNINITICTNGYTAKIRPPVSYTEQLKKTLLNQYGDTVQNFIPLSTGKPDLTKCIKNSSNPYCYELDHFIPLEAGGDPSGIKNLYPEPRFGTPNAFDKDVIENICHKKICSGEISLQKAQSEIQTNWETACH